MMLSIRQWAWLVNLLLLAAVSYAVAALTMQLLGARLESEMLPVVVSGPAQQQEARREKLALAAFQPILDANIFRARRSEVKPKTPGDGSEAQLAAVAKVPLSLLLTGTVIMGKRAFAMIANAGGRDEKLYQLHDCVPAGDKPTQTCEPNQGKLVRVKRKEITIDYQGEKLIFEIVDRKAPAPEVAAAPARRAAPPKALERPEADGADGAPFPMTQDGNVFQVRVPGTEVAQAFENFSDVLKQARVVPYTDEAGQGFQIRNIRPGSIFARIGLNNFDKIKAVNGEAITTADQALRLLTMFRNEREINLELERNNQPIQLNYTIE